MYIATFYSHFGAIRYKRLCGERNIPLHSDPVQVYGQLPFGELLGEALPDLLSLIHI